MARGFGSSLWAKLALLIVIIIALSSLLVGCGNETAMTAATPAATSVAATTAPPPSTTANATTAPSTTAAPSVSVRPTELPPTTQNQATTAAPTTEPPRPTATTTTAATTVAAKTTPTQAAASISVGGAFSAEKAFAHVKELAETIGIRAAGTEGERKAGDYIENYFKQLGLATERPPVEYTVTRDSGSTLAYQDKAGQAVNIKGNAVNLSGSGKLTAVLSYAGLGLDGQITPGSLNGKIALIQRGQLTFSEKVQNAVAGGAVGVVIYNNTDGPLNVATLNKQASVPVLGLSQADGEKLRDELRANQNFALELNVNIYRQTLKMTNVVGLRPASGPDKDNAPLLIIGGHYDSVPAGPGANDNASGTAVMMELARVLHTQYPKYEIRYIGFAGEEIGLAGSSEYVRQMSPTERQRVVAMINIDMISVGPNFYVGGVPELTKVGLAAAVEAGAGNVQVIPPNLSGASDHYAFQEAKMPVLFFNREDDPNYHKPGDTADKVPPDRLAQVGKIVIKVIDGLARG